MTPDPHTHHHWGLQKGPQARFPRDVPHRVTQGPASPAKPVQESADPQEHTPIADRIAPELHAIVDRTLEHVAALQAQAVREARGEAQETSRREREVFERLLGGLSRHSEELDRLAESVGGIAGSLRQELEAIDAAVAKLTGSEPLHEPAEPHELNRTG
jgi:hypothetical protein